MTENNLKLHLDTDQNLIPQDIPAQRVIEISLHAPVSTGSNNRPHLNLALVLDRSGSMSGEKLEYVKLAAKHVLDMLQEQDRVAMVAYDDEISVLSTSVPVTSSNRNELKRRVSSLEIGGSTNLSDGWLAGCKEAASAAQEGTLNRSLLLTDGLANAGITDLEELAMHARELSRRGISTSTFGVGEGFNEHLLEAMSNQGGGSFYYIENPRTIPELFLREFKELSTVTARDVEIALDFPPQVSLQVLGGWRTEVTADQMRIYLGNLVSDQTQEIYIKLLTPPAGENSQLKFTAHIFGKGENGEILEVQDEISFRYENRETVEAEPRKRDVLERFGQVDLAETANEALKLERNGENEKASRMLQRSIDENASYIEPEKAKDYQHMAERMRRGMDESDRKASHYNTYNQKRRRQQ